MKIEIQLLPEIKDPYAVIYTNEINSEIRRITAIFETESSGFIPVVEKERIVMLHSDEIYMVRVENEKTVIYVKEKHYISKKRLYELEAALGNEFMRISKSTISNLHFLDYVEPTLGGLMLIVLKNGCRDYISRKYLPAFKQYLGI